MSERAQFDAPELAAMRAEMAAGRRPACPRCAVPMTERPVGGGSFGMGYQRRRAWLICPRCRRSAMFDVQRGTRT